MQATSHIRATLKPWDDPHFHRAYEAARRQAAEADADADAGDGLRAAVTVERLLHDAGYPQARVEVERTVEEALTHVEHWHVLRDG